MLVEVAMFIYCNTTHFLMALLRFLQACVNLLFHLRQLLLRQVEMITKTKRDPGSKIEGSHLAGVKPFSTLVAVFLSCSGQKMKFPIKDLFSK